MRSQQLSGYISPYLLLLMFRLFFWFSTYMVVFMTFTRSPNEIISVPCLNQLKWIFDMRLADSSASLGYVSGRLGEGRTKRAWDIPSCLPSLSSLPLSLSALKIKLILSLTERERDQTHQLLGNRWSAAPAPPGWDCLISRRHMPNPFTTFQIV